MKTILLNYKIFRVGHVYKFKYKFYKHDPIPFIVFLSAERIQKNTSTNDYIYGINLHYINNIQKYSVLNEVITTTITKVTDWDDTFRRYYFLKDILRRYKISGIERLFNYDIYDILEDNSFTLL